MGVGLLKYFVLSQDRKYEQKYSFVLLIVAHFCRFISGIWKQSEQTISVMRESKHRPQWQSKSEKNKQKYTCLTVSYTAFCKDTYVVVLVTFLGYDTT